MNNAETATSVDVPSQEASGFKLQFRLSTLLLFTACAATWTAALLYGWQLIKIESQIQNMGPIAREFLSVEPRPVDGSETIDIFGRE